MTEPIDTRTAGDADPIVEEVSSWPGVVVAPHRFGAAEFTVGGREVGHVHGGRVLDVNYPKRVRDLLIAEGLTGEHHVAGGGWTTYHVESEADLPRAFDLLRLSYLYNVLALRKKPVGQTILEAIDLDTDLHRLAPDGDLRAVFERMRD